MCNTTLSPPEGFCIKMGSAESRVNVSLTVKGKSQESVQKLFTVFEEKGEPKRNRIEVLLLTSLRPYRQAKPAHACRFVHLNDVNVKTTVENETDRQPEKKNA